MSHLRQQTSGSALSPDDGATTNRFAAGIIQTTVYQSYRFREGCGSAMRDIDLAENGAQGLPRVLQEKLMYLSTLGFRTK
jgi:hypothetical protein